jgi:hypothetical protein
MVYSGRGDEMIVERSPAGNKSSSRINRTRFMEQSKGTWPLEGDSRKTIVKCKEWNVAEQV